MRKIVVITQYYKPEIGAPQNRLYEMAVGLKSNGWDVSIITAMPNYPTGKVFNEYRNSLFRKDSLDGLEIRRYWLYASNSKRVVPRILSMLSFSLSIFFSLTFLCKSRFDYIVVESPPLTLGLSGYILARLVKAKLIFNVSDLWPLTAKELGVISDGYLYKKLEGIERFIYKNAFICMGQSQEIVDYIGVHGAQRVYLFRNGVDPDRFKSHVLIKSANKKIVYTGLLGVAQGILDICRNINFKELDSEFHVYGAGFEKEALEKFLKANPERGIFYHGLVSREEIPAVLSGYSATLIALNRNIYGAVPSKIYESMAAGLPIIFTGEGEGRSIIEKNDLGWTSPAKDYEALKLNIQKFSLNRNEWEAKSKNCLNAATELFNRPKQIKFLNEYLLSFINLELS